MTKRRIITMIACAFIAVFALAGAVACAKKTNSSPINFIVSNNDEMAIGAVQALQEQDLNKGGSGATYSNTIPVVGVDASDAGQQAVKNKEMAGTVKQDGAKMANLIVQVAQNAVNGEDASSWLDGVDGYNYVDGSNRVFIDYEVYSPESQETKLTDTVARASGKVETFYYDFADTYISSVRSVLDDGLRGAGFEVKPNDAGNNSGSQMTQIDAALGTADLLIVNLVNNGDGQEILDRAKAAGKPVILFNKEPAADQTESANIMNSNPKSAYVGAVARQSGEMQAQIIFDLFTGKSQILTDKSFAIYDQDGDGELDHTDIQLNYGILLGQAGHQDASERRDGFASKVKELFVAAGLKAPIEVKAEYANPTWSSAGGKQIVGSWLASPGVAKPKE